MNNIEIKNAAARRGVRLWEIAEWFGIADTTLSKWLRHEFTADRKAEFMRAIDEICKSHLEAD